LELLLQEVIKEESNELNMQLEQKGNKILVIENRKKVEYTKLLKENELQAGATHTRTNFSTTSSTKSVSRFLLVDSSKEQKFFSLDRGDKSLA
jgi:hypothetical protein